MDSVLSPWRIKARYKAPYLSLNVSSAKSIINNNKAGYYLNFVKPVYIFYQSYAAPALISLITHFAYKISSIP